jgi:hypothetical protein
MYERKKNYVPEKITNFKLMIKIFFHVILKRKTFSMSDLDPVQFFRIRPDVPDPCGTVSTTHRKKWNSV